MGKGHIMKWQTTAGPRQTKEAERAIREFDRLAESHTELSGVVGGEESSCVLWSPFGGISTPTAIEALEKIGVKYAWTVTADNFRALIADCHAAQKDIVLAVVDNRRSGDEEAQRIAANRVRDEEGAKLSAARAAICVQVMAKRPVWAERLIIAELEEDQSDSMSDYHGSKTVRKVAIGWGRGKRENFAQLREAAAQFPDTADMGPGCDDWRALAYRNDDPQEKYRAYSRVGPSFTTETAARTWIESQRQAAEVWRVEWKRLYDAGDTDGLNRLQESGATTSDPAPYGYTLECEPIEQRENWSMGAGNYLSRTGRYGSGWKVSSVLLGHSIDVWEDGITERTAPLSIADGPTTAATGPVTVSHNAEKGGIELTFAEKPAREIIDRLKANGWRWSGRQGLWYTKQSERAEVFANEIAGLVTA